MMGEGDELGLEEVAGGTDPLSMSLAALSAVQDDTTDPLSSSMAGLTAEPEEELSNLVQSTRHLPRLPWCLLLCAQRRVCLLSPLLAPTSLPHQRRDSPALSSRRPWGRLFSFSDSQQGWIESNFNAQCGHDPLASTRDGERDGVWRCGPSSTATGRANGRRGWLGRDEWWREESRGR